MSSSSLSDNIQPTKVETKQEQNFNDDSFSSLEKLSDIDNKEVNNTKIETKQQNLSSDDMDNNLSDISDDYDNIKAKKEVKKQENLSDSFNSLSDDYARDNNIGEEKRDKKSKSKKNKQKNQDKFDRRIRREFGTGQAQSKNQKRQELEDEQKRKADEEVEQVITEMQTKFEEDLKAQRNNKPYINKILYCNYILQKLNNTFFRTTFTEDTGLNILGQWFNQGERDDSLTLIKKILRIIEKLDLISDNILTSQLVRKLIKIRHRIVHNDLGVTFLDQDAQTHIVNLVDNWAPLFVNNRGGDQMDEQNEEEEEY